FKPVMSVSFIFPVFNYISLLFKYMSTTVIYTLSLHDALPIFYPHGFTQKVKPNDQMKICSFLWVYYGYPTSTYEGVNVEKMRYRSEEHTSELQSRFDLVCRLLLEKKKSNNVTHR